MTMRAGCSYGIRFIALFCIQLLLLRVFASKEVFFNTYGDCERIQPYELGDDDYSLRPVGGGFVHENLVCAMTFKAPPEYGICLIFDELEITDCAVRLKVFSSATSSGATWRILDCNDSKPGQMCTSSRYVTVQVSKDKLNSNRGYKFKIRVEKSNSITEEGVLFASIGVFVGVIFGVVIITAILAISILYCCCKYRHGTKKNKRAHTGAATSHEGRSLVQPSAPPPDVEDQHWIPHQQGHLYPFYGPYQHGQHPPPPYVPPPPYQPNDISTQELVDVQRETHLEQPQ